MNTKYVLAALVVALPCAAQAQDAGKYRCTQGDLVRRVEIYTEPGASVPCEVHYFKDSEAPGESQVLWSASAEAGYCEARTEEFVARLRGWGWDCNASAAADADVAPEPDAVPEPEVQDDTDVLSPGEPEG